MDSMVWLKTPKLRGKPGKWTELMSDQRLTHELWLKLSSGRQNTLHFKLNMFSYKEIRPGYLYNQFVFTTTITTPPPSLFPSLFQSSENILGNKISIWLSIGLPKGTLLHSKPPFSKCVPSACFWQTLASLAQTRTRQTPSSEWLKVG